MLNVTKPEENLITSLMHKYLPFWPLFIILLIVAISGAWVYLHSLVVPNYEISATLIIKDEKKGVSYTRMAESIDAFITNNIVENEIKVIQSRDLMTKVVEDLMLYAPIYEEQDFKSTPAYISSPIRIELKSLENITEYDKIYFVINEDAQSVEIGNKSYPINKWVKTPYGELKFIRNKNQERESSFPLYFSLIEPKKAADRLLSNLSVEAENKLSTVVNLTFHDPEPKRGEDILNRLINTYAQVTIDERNKLASSTLQFVEGRMKQVESELKDLEKQVVTFKSKRGAVDLSEQGKMYLKNVGDNDQQINEINLQLAVLEKVEKYVTSQSGASSIVPSTLGIKDAVLSELLLSLYNAETQYQKLSKTTAENNPLLISIAEEIKKIKPSILENIRTQRANLIASRANIAATNNLYNTELQAIPEKERELLDISRKQAVKNNTYSFLLQKREEAVLSKAPSAIDSRVIDMARASMSPVSPRPLHIYLIAIMLACMVSGAFITSKELLNNNVLFRSEITKFTNAPIVAEISHVKHKNGDIYKSLENVVIVEQFRQLRTTLGLYGRTFTKKRLMITSNIPGEGKSFISKNLALSLAASGRNIALLDFDLRNPNTTYHFNLDNQVGMIEYLQGAADLKDIIKRTSFNNLSIIPAGTNIGDHSELWLNGKLEDFFIVIENMFDYIIIDTPPIDLVSDAFLISEYCDISLLVIRHAFTPKSLIRRLPYDNKMKSLKNVAIVFNGVRPRGFIKGKYGFGYGYGNEQRYEDKTYRTRYLPKT